MWMFAVILVHASHTPPQARLLHHPRAPCPTASAAPGAGGSDDRFDDDYKVLETRIADLNNNVANVRLLVLDPMLPGQRLRTAVPPQLVGVLRDAPTLVMVGRERMEPNSHGVEVEVEAIVERPDLRHVGLEADVVLAARRFCSVLEVGPDEGSRWLGRAARVQWIALDDEEVEQADEVRERSEALARLSSLWIDLVRSTGREREKGQLDAVLGDLGDMPDAPNARALWVAALINPLPALGLALEIRPSALMAGDSVELRQKIVQMGILDSIERLRREG